MRATYNITTNRFKVWFDERLSPEDYKRAKECNFVWYPGQKCFSSIWYPQAEDFIKSFGIEIEEDDTPDDVEARVNRFEKYADRAEREAENSADYARRDDITERRAAAAEKRAQTETEKAEHWNQRIAGAIAHAQYKDRPDVIARRIKGLEADLRRKERDLIIKGEHDGYKLTGNNHWIKPENVPALQENARRWVEHLTRRLEYERAYFVAVGGVEPEPKERRKPAPAPNDGIKKGSRVSVKMPPYYSSTLTGEVVSLGSKTCTVHLNRDGREFDYKTPRYLCSLEAQE